MKPVDILLVILLNLLWAGVTIVSKYAMVHFPPLMFAALRFTFFAVALLPWLKWQKGHMKTLVFMGIVLGPVILGLMFTGVALSSASVVAVVGQMGVPLAVLLSVIMLKEKVVWWRWIGVILAFAGVAYIGFDPSVFHYLVGMAFVIAGTLVSAFAAVYQRTVKVPVMQMLAWVALISAVVLWIASLILEKGHVTALVTADWRNWASVFYVGAIATMISDSLYFYLIRKYHVSRITPLTLLAPLFTIAMGVTLMGDKLTEQMIIGGAVALVGVLLVSIQAKEKLPANPMEPEAVGD